MTVKRRYWAWALELITILPQFLNLKSQRLQKVSRDFINTELLTCLLTLIIQKALLNKVAQDRPNVCRSVSYVTRVRNDWLTNDSYYSYK